MKALIAGGGIGGVTTALCLIDSVAFRPKALEMRTGRLATRIVNTFNPLARFSFELEMIR